MFILVVPEFHVQKYGVYGAYYTHGGYISI